MTLSILEIAVLLFGAIILGATIYYFIASRSRIKSSSEELEKERRRVEEWKHRYRNDMDLRDAEIGKIKTQLKEATESSDIFAIEAEEKTIQKRKLQEEAEELRLENKKLKAEMLLLQQEQLAQQTILPAAAPEQQRPDYLVRLQEAQEGLMEQNKKINELLGNIDMIKETEEKQREILRDNEELYHQVSDLQKMLDDKEREINNIRQQKHLTTEMNAMLDSAYGEFNILQDKIKKLESQANLSRSINIEYEDLKEAHYRVTKDLEDQKARLRILTNDNQHFQQELAETEEKLKEANFQRQQLQKKVAYLEELNNDLQVMADANKKLEGQLRRIGELESMLHVVSEERDELVKKQQAR